MPNVVLEDVYKAFNGVPVLSGVSLQIDAGETLVIIGRSGTGKSVTLKHIIGLLAPDRGKIIVFGRDIATLSYREVLAMRLKIGYLFQGGALLNWLSIAENVALPLREHRHELQDAEIMRIVDEKLGIVGMLGARNKLPSEISGGMQKRAGLARAIVMEPSIILYDEPTSGLDPVMSGSINQLVRRTQQVTGATQLVVTHDMASAYAIADRIAMIYEGRIIAIGTPDEIKACADPIVAQFIRGNPLGPITSGDAPDATPDKEKKDAHAA
jgi:phospholipid/cholesterol/gamma-HCH transport system ATP-binding protein